ncbi:MAG: DUF951 domain-containing protein [Oscillospiraceae bacterium]|nr:DUF951 domain-containing protein [Oscillospiraceae bacterium]
MDIRVGDIVTLKKDHPCGGRKWEVLRVGMDFRMRCLTCGREMMQPRSKMEKMITYVSRGET